MRILLVENDPAQLNLLQTTLTDVGHVVDGLQLGEEAQWALHHRSYDLLILDWILPDVSGLDLCRQYRRSGKTAPVMILTARDTTLDKVMGLDAGADDYLVKPADMPELLARVRALGRRSPRWQSHPLRVADLTLQFTSLSIERDGMQVELSCREFQLLEYLLQHPNQVLSRGQIEQALWRWGEEPESNAITSLIRRVRKRLQQIDAAEWIETIYGIGYRLSPL
jgi:DNA-binding response OmpR family regulator